MECCNIDIEKNILCDILSRSEPGELWCIWCSRDKKSYLVGEKVQGRIIKGMSCVVYFANELMDEAIRDIKYLKE